MDFNVIIRNATVVDGTRLPRRRADIGIKNGRVAKIGRIAADAHARRVLDATGCVVAPGFVDVHTHYDAQIHWDPYCTISGWHGVTSVALGNCGFGFAPVKPAERDRALLMMTRTEQIPLETMKEGMEWRWETFPEWLENLQNIPKGVNILSYVPVNPLMVYVMGLEAAKSRPATPAERKEMQRLLNEAMDAGACGFSIQRLGERSLQADVDGTPMPTDTMADEDVFALAEVLKARDEGVIQITQQQGAEINSTGTDSRRRDLDFLEKLAEVSGAPVIHNSLFVLDYNPEHHKAELEWVHQCNARGLRIYGQGNNVRVWFQFTLDVWNFYDPSPAWNFATQGTHEEKVQKLSDPALRAQMRAEHDLLHSTGETALPENLTIVGAPDANPELKRYIGRTVGEIAEAEGKDPTDVMVDISLAGDLQVEFRTQLQSSGDADLVAPLMSDPYVLAGVSDGGAHTKFFTGGSFTTDFLTWLVRDTGKISLEEAHWHLSYLPAQAAGFTDRGFLREGAPADIVVYDLDKLKRVPEWDLEIVHDFPAGEWRRIQRAEGYRWILVNGVPTFEDGVCTGATPGMLLRNRQADESVFATAAE